MDSRPRHTPISIAARLAATWFLRWEGRFAEQHANSDAPGSPQAHAMHRPAYADGQITYFASKVI